MTMSRMTRRQGASQHLSQNHHPISRGNGAWGQRLAENTWMSCEGIERRARIISKKIPAPSLLRLIGPRRPPMFLYRQLKTAQHLGRDPKTLLQHLSANRGR